MVTYRDLVVAFRRLEMDARRPVIAHVSLSAFGEIQGGAETVVGSLVSGFRSVIMPAFTYKTMVIPEEGPPENGVEYGSGKISNAMVEFFHPDMPTDRMIGRVAEKFRTHARAVRSTHPILSFAGVNAEAALGAQNLDDPLGPIRHLVEAQGWVLLLGVSHTVNTSIHYAERLAGRKQFIRWALTPQGVQACLGFPGCSDGFDALEPHIAPFTRKVEVGKSSIRAIPVQELIETARGLIQADPQALLCNRDYCERCSTVRLAIAERS